MPKLAARAAAASADHELRIHDRASSRVIKLEILIGLRSGNWMNSEETSICLKGDDCGEQQMAELEPDCAGRREPAFECNRRGTAIAAAARGRTKRRTKSAQGTILRLAARLLLSDGGRGHGDRIRSGDLEVQLGSADGRRWRAAARLWN